WSISQMKKTLLALAVMGASGVAFAASNVTLYGVIDTSVVFTHDGGAKDAKNVVDMQSSFRNGSRWGIKGVEELGNGYAVGFILEDGFNSDDGSGAQSMNGAFSRESKLYINGGFGQIGFGRLGSLAGGAQSNSILSGWALGTSYQTQGTLTSFMKNNGRVNNAVAYVSPSFAGLTVHAMYSNGTKTDTAEWAKNNHYYGLGLAYQLGGYRNTLIFESADNKGGNGETAYNVNLGLGYNLGAITPQFAYQYAWQDTQYKQHVFGLSAAAPVAGGTVKAGVKYLLGKNETDAFKAATGEDKYRSLSISAAYEYPLSKRTTVWGFASWADGDKGYSSDNLKNLKASGDSLKTANFDGYVFSVGMTHNF
ncbi:porin, partial [uncultured Parasutterella sp.]|uniref:porin n=3 Tax=Sutterellaceae TaxID=995019 RepID=UPI002597C279